MTGDTWVGMGTVLALVLGFVLKRLPNDVLYNKIIPIITFAVSLLSQVAANLGGTAPTISPSAALNSAFGPVLAAFNVGGGAVQAGFLDGVFGKVFGAVMTIGVDALGYSVFTTGIHGFGKNLMQGLKTGFTPPALK